MMTMKAYIAGVGHTRFGQWKESLTEMMGEAAQAALDSISSKKASVDALLVGTMNPAQFTGEDNIAANITDRLGLNPMPAFRIENAPASGSAALHQAIFAISAGMFHSVLVLAGEKMSQISTKMMSKYIAHLTPKEERVSGATMPGLVAMMARRYMYEHSLSREDLALVPVKSHNCASHNPHAHFHKSITVDDVLSSPLVADPLRLYDCAPISDGACGVVVTADKSDVEIAGFAHGADALYYQHRSSISNFPVTGRTAHKAYEMAGVAPEKIDVVETHDAFSILELINTEDLGLFGRGESIKALKSGATGVEGDVPVNPSGGLKAKGHPLGATGLAQVCELYWQLVSEAGRRQVDGAEIGLAHNMGGFGNNAAVTILRKVQ
ncbi:MAG: thiolase domain-containing protein [Thermoplasmata archaeon]|nr:MAG: thiolase domain-containing protein [Thermoplasmata archaeon]